jgi:hypothetical protein
MAEQIYGFNKDTIKRIAAAVRQVESMNDLGGSGKRPAPQLPTIFAELTADNGSGVFDWQQKIANDDGTWSDGALSGTDADGNPAIEINGDGFSIGKRVILARLPTVDDDGNIKIQWVFQAGGTEAVGMYLGMVHLVVSANTGGWDWMHAHSLLP